METGADKLIRALLRCEWLIKDAIDAKVDRAEYAEATLLSERATVLAEVRIAIQRSLEP